MKKYKYFLVLFSLLFLSSAKAQYDSNTALKVSLNYVFGNKKSDIKNGLNFKTGLIFKASDYFYFGPQINLNKFFLKEENKSAPINVDFDVVSQVLFSRLIYQEIIKTANKKTENSDFAFNFAFGFNLDKNSSNQKAFNFSRVGLGFDFYSKEVLNKNIYLNVEGNIYYKRELLKNFFAAGLGGAIGL